MTHTNKLLLVLAVALAGCGDDGGGSNNNPAQPAIGAQIDRSGRAAISTALIETFSGDEAAKGTAKDAYNKAAPATWPTFIPQMETSLAILDSLDADCGNQLLADDTNTDGRYNALAGILADDQLYVNTASGTCGVYLGLEAEIVGALAAGEGGCGGRTPADDIIDRSYSVLAAGILTGVDDTIAADDCSFSATFPYLCAAN